MHQTYKGNKWALPGGAVKPNEAPWNAVVREVKEETGFDVEWTRHSMAIEKSSGAVVFYRGKQIEYLLLLSTYWGFPKGLVEAGEDERTAALREVREETGLEVVLLDGFRTVDSYWYRRGDERINKRAIYLLAEAHSRDAHISHEHADMAWLTYNAAMARLDFVGLRETLRKANEFVLKCKT